MIRSSLAISVSLWGRYTRVRMTYFLTRLFSSSSVQSTRGKDSSPEPPSSFAFGCSSFSAGAETMVDVFEYGRDKSYAPRVAVHRPPLVVGFMTDHLLWQRPGNVQSAPFQTCLEPAGCGISVQGAMPWASRIKAAKSTPLLSDLSTMTFTACSSPGSTWQRETAVGG